jgi:transketolase
MIEDEAVERLTKQAQTIRCHILAMVTDAQVGHIGGSFSSADIPTALYFHIMRIDPKIFKKFLDIFIRFFIN